MPRQLDRCPNRLRRLDPTSPQRGRQRQCNRRPCQSRIAKVAYTLTNFAPRRIRKSLHFCGLLSMPSEYQNPGPIREEIDATNGPILVEFGTAWCGYCQAAAPAIAEALAQFPSVQHIQIEDGPGRLLGRSFRVKLWPTAI